MLGARERKAESTQRKCRDLAGVRRRCGCTIFWEGRAIHLVRTGYQRRSVDYADEQASSQWRLVGRRGGRERNEPSDSK